MQALQGEAPLRARQVAVPEVAQDAVRQAVRQVVLQDEAAQAVRQVAAPEAPQDVEAPVVAQADLQAEEGPAAQFIGRAARSAAVTVTS